MPKLATGSQTVDIRVGLNVTISGSKDMTRVEKEELEVPEVVRVLIVDANDPTNVLVDDEAPYTQFSSGNTGWMYHQKAQFHEVKPE